MFTICLPYQAERVDESFTMLFNGHRGQLSMFWCFDRSTEKCEHKLDKGWASPNSLKPRNCGQTQDIRRISSKATLGTPKNFRHWKGGGGDLKKKQAGCGGGGLLIPARRRQRLADPREFHPGLLTKYQASQGCKVRPCHPNKQTSKELRKTNKNDKKWREGGRRGGKRKKRFRSHTSQL